MKNRVILILTVVAVIAGPTWAVRPEKTPSTTYLLSDRGIVASPRGPDGRASIAHLPGKDAKKSAAMESGSKAWEEFVARTGKGWSVRWNRTTGTPRLVTGRPLGLPGIEKLTRENIEAACLDFVAANGDLLKAAPGQLRLANKVKAGGRWYVSFRQMYNGVPVLGGQLNMSFTKDDRLIMFGSDVYPDVMVETKPKVHQKEVMRLARADCEETCCKDRIGDVELCVLPLRRPERFDYRLCWKLYIFQPDLPKKWEYLIDAADGKIISKQNVLVYENVTGTAQGEYKPEYGSDPTEVDTFPHEDVSAEGLDIDIASWDFNSDPGWITEGQWAFGTPTGGGGDWGYCTDPTSGYTGSNVYGYNLNGDYTDNMPAYYLTTTTINCSGHENVQLKFMRWLGVESQWWDNASIEVSNNGIHWVTVWNNGESIICDGAWVRVRYDISAVADLQPTVYIRWVMGPTDGSVCFPGWNIDDVKVVSRLGGVNTTQTQADGSYSVLPPWNPSTITSELAGLYCDIDYACGADALFEQTGVAPDDVVDFTWDSTWYNEIVESSVYWHTNYIHDFYLAMDPSLANPSPRFPSGMNYRMPVIVQSGCEYGYCNAYWDGQGMTFGAGDGGYCDSFGLYAEIIYHEYTHGVSDNIYEGFYFPYAMEPGAMNEGWSDYYGCSLSVSESPLVGEGGALLPYPDGFRTLDNTYRRETDFSNGVHFDSQMFSGGLWEARQQIGAEIMDELVHFARYAHAETFEEYLFALLVEDDTRYGDSDLSNGTPHAEAIYTGFGNHGIGGLQYAAPSVVIDDASGNGNGKLEPGETANLSLTLTNGWADASNVSATLASGDAFVTITKAGAGFPNVNHGGMTENGADPFVVSLDSACPETHTLYFTLEVSADGPYSYSRTCLFTYAVAVNQSAYDDGQADSYIGHGSPGGAQAVRITPDSYPCYPTQIRLYPYPYQGDIPIIITVWDDDGPGGLPGTVLGSLETTVSTTEGWVDIEISSLSINIDDGSFYIGWIEGDYIYFNGMDMDPPYYQRSWVYFPWSGDWMLFDNAGFLANLMVRVRYIYTSPTGPVQNLTTGDRYDFIQHAIYKAESGHEIVVGEGVYTEYVDFLGKDLIVRSTDPEDPEVVAATIINAGDLKPGVRITEFGENRVLAGFTITDCNYAIYCEYSNPTISNCIITDNAGTGIWCFRSTPAITNCTISGSQDEGIYSEDSCVNITNCTVLDSGAAGIHCETSILPTITNCLIADNNDEGICFRYNLMYEPVVTNCTIVENGADGIYTYSPMGYLTTITNSIIWYNLGHQIEGPSVVTYSSVEGDWPGTGNTDADPCFVKLWSCELKLSERALSPNPADGAINVDPNVVLSWLPGAYAVSHDVYFGTSFDSVSNATTDSTEYMGNQDSNSWDTTDYDPSGLGMKTTYYWRIDEVNDSNVDSPWKGRVWSFNTLDPNLVGWWKFDEGDGDSAADSTVYDNNGTTTGAVSWVQGLGSGYALEFDDGRVTIPDANELRPKTQLTVSAWVNYPEAQDEFARVAAKGNNDYETFSMEIEGDILVFLVRDDEYYANWRVWSQHTIEHDEWTHVAGVYNGSVVSCYLNGQLEDSLSAGPITLSQDIGDMGIGNAADVSRPFEGTIDEVAVYNRGLSAEEILQLYQGGATPPDEPTIQCEGNYHLLPDSPCIDAGDNNSVPDDSVDLDGDSNTTEPIPFDLDGNRRFIDYPDVPDTGNGTPPIVDMGAYEAFVPPIRVRMRFTPQTLNPDSRGRWVKAHFVLPEEYTVDDVDTSTPATLELLGTEVQSEYIHAFVNDSNTVGIEIAFERDALCDVGTNDEFAEATVTGSLTRGRRFYGTDTIRIVDHKFKCLAAFAAHWLEMDCGPPDWCDGLDLDHSSVVNFADFALLDGCCIKFITE